MTVGPGHAWQRLMLELGNRELSTGLAFVALSRAMNLGCIAFPPGKFPTDHRLELCKTEKLGLRQDEDGNLDQHANETRQRAIRMGLLSRGLAPFRCCGAIWSWRYNVDWDRL